MPFCLYGLDNFYYRRSYLDIFLNVKVYTDLIISTIVDQNAKDLAQYRLYGLDNFYYRRFHSAFLRVAVYTDLIISTIVDSSTLFVNGYASIRT